MQAIEYRSRLVEVADKLLQLAHPQEAASGDDSSSQGASVTMKSSSTNDVDDRQTCSHDSGDGK